MCCNDYRRNASKPGAGRKKENKERKKKEKGKDKHP
jgi:hypothetical protein